MSKRERFQQLESTVATIQARWGDRALTVAREASLPSGLSSGIAELDALLPTGGFPRGHLSEICGYGTAGHLPVAARALAQTQRASQGQASQYALVVDAESNVDLDTLAHCGVHLDKLALLRARNLQQALQMTSDLLRAGFVGTMLFDRLHDLYALSDSVALQALEQALRDWGPLLARSATTLLWLTELSLPGTYPEGLPLAYAASVRLLFQRQRWLTEAKRVVGYVSQVTVLKSRGGTPAGNLLLRFPLL